MSFRRAHIVLLAALVLCAGFSMLALEAREGESVNANTTGGVILHVDDDAPQGGDGLTWRSGFRFLQDALDAAREPGSDVSEVRIAQGEYKPDQGASVTPGDVDASFEMVSDLAARGGYRGAYDADAVAFDPAQSPDDRDFERFETILSGDLLGNDVPGTFQNYDDNSFHIMRLADPAPGTIVEGLTVTASNTDYDLATFGGGIQCVGGTLTVTQCEFKRNLAYYGGGLHSNGTDLTLTHCLFQNNFAEAVSGSGGGAMIQGGHIVIEDCNFIGNGCEFGDTGGLYVVAASSRTERCNFLGNGSGDRSGGAGFHSGAVLIDCRFIGNSTAIDGGGLVGGSLRINCEFSGNYAGQLGGGMRASGVSIGCTFEANNTGFEGGGGFVGGGTFINCRFLRNGSAKGFDNEGGAAGWILSPVGGSFINCVFSGNDSDGAGGAVYVNPGLPASFTNCVFTNNETEFGQAGAIAGHGTITNCVLWNNSPDDLSGDFTTTFSCIDGGWPGQGNIGGDPMFVNPLGRDGVPGTLDDDLRLHAGSPCIDAGSNLALPADSHDIDDDGNVTEPLPLDFAGGLRVVNDPRTRNTGVPPSAGAIVDMGAFEFRDFRAVAGDITLDGQVNIDDLLAVIASWGPCPAPPAPCEADLDGDDEVTISDLLLVLSNWNP
jgi:hypothetical protein